VKISFCTWIYNRLWQYCQTLEENLARAKGFDAEFVLLDVHSNDGLEDWLNSRKLMNQVSYYRERHDLHVGRLKNRAHELAKGSVLVNLDADNVIGIDYCQTLIQNLDENTVFHGWSGDWSDGTCGRLAYTRNLFNRFGGYDESLGPIGNDDLDFRDRAIAAGARVVVKTSANVVGHAIPNTRHQAEKYFSVSWGQGNSANAAKSQENIAARRLVANSPVTNQATNKMRIICLMPTYGRRAELLNNSLACFFAQDHADKHLFILDDLGTLAGCKLDDPYREHVSILSTEVRSSSVGEKYNEMIGVLESSGYEYDAVAVWDDDDIYLPKYLSSHARVMQDHRWSKPSVIVSAHFQPPKQESANGRFHGSIAVRRDLVRQCPWIDTTRATFDQEYLTALGTHATPGDPCELADPQYVYRWQTSRAGHCSGLMGSATWYADYKPDSREPIKRLWPEFDADTHRFFTSEATA
jgi:hypothetical protein